MFYCFYLFYVLEINDKDDEKLFIYTSFLIRSHKSQHTITIYTGPDSRVFGLYSLELEPTNFWDLTFRGVASQGSRRSGSPSHHKGDL